MTCLKEEKSVGLETFFTKQSGIKGKLRTQAEDFIVEELFQKPPLDEEGSFTIATVTSKNWETNQLIRSLSKSLQISRNRIHFAGTKDKRSVSTQLFSFYRIKPERIQQIQLKNVTISNIYPSNKKLYIGDLKGNHFSITIRNIPKKINEKSMYELLQPINKIQGFPNFFGIQRFGIIRPITHLVGKYLMQADFEKAVMTYLTFLDDHEDLESYQARKQLLETNDFKKAFHDFPNHLIYEKSMLNILQVDPNDFIGAIKELPKNLITMFVYAYQSYLFNRILCERIRRNLPIDAAILGDVILPMKNGNPIDEPIAVSSINVDKVNRQIKREKAVVSSILLGRDSVLSKGEMGEIERKIIADENVDKRDFIIPDIPLASSFGTRRGLFAPLQNLSYQIIDDTLYADKKAVQIQFDLKKGCYATSFLREIMKTDDIRNY